MSLGNSSFKRKSDCPFLAYFHFSTEQGGLFEGLNKHHLDRTKHQIYKDSRHLISGSLCDRQHSLGSVPIHRIHRAFEVRRLISTAPKMLTSLLAS